MNNSGILPGTTVKFTSDSRLRKIAKDGVRSQSSMNEGMIIGEQAEAVITQVLSDGYIVYFKEHNLVGWVYNYELYVKDPNAKPEKLNFVKV